MSSKVWLWLFSFRGRLTRSAFLPSVLALGIIFGLIVYFVNRTAGSYVALAFYPPSLWIFLALSFRRLKDIGRPLWWPLILAVPIFGPTIIAFDLFCGRGTDGENQYGKDPRSLSRDYFTVS